MPDVMTEQITASSLADQVAASLHERVGDLSNAMRSRLSTRIVELEGEGAIFELLYASIEGNVENIFYALRHDIAVDNIEPPSAAYEYARRLAQRGVPVSALVRAYRLGQQFLLEQAFVEFETMEAEPELRAAGFERVVAVTFDYIDWISQRVITVYEEERERWLAERSSARASKIEALLAGTETDIDAAEAVIGYRLRVTHLGAVLWVHETGTQQDQVARFTKAANAIAEHLDSKRNPLVLPRDRASAWAWFAVREDVEPDLDVIHSLLADIDGPPLPMVALGRPRAGLAGFSQTHHDAVKAQQVAQVRDDPTRPVTSFGEPGLKVASLLAGDLRSTREWVRDTLGDLALGDEHHERLRHTLLLFFQHESSYTATAEAMLMHKNSVKYRIASAEKAMGRSISSDRQAIELALTACDWLGPAVLA
ncbi:PucR family transcriptional regulator [Nocardioides caeni]|uniref:PucR family transcriptional regulator n=1 Tax=Nocardioides caeni TaxID=574700 RepID=A0A4S8MZS7_9ACTN|nr:helix-turn-helix domain-containing protein [Nocardioides caeni]THV08855.1 PucR family transcriptional regulator [Nocardioides caeni]